MAKNDLQRCHGGPGQGKLFVVGIGPGDPLDRTHRAEAAIIGSNVVVGYRQYVDLIADLTKGKEIVASGMTKEVDRCREALRHAVAGKTVALVSSGDPGVYGMAGLVLEMAAGEDYYATIEVIPGVTSANAGAARMGAPLMLDYATISLSDLLISWTTIRTRLAATTARRLSLPYLTFVRPGIAPENTPEITFAADHEEAARLACADGKAVLLTTGSRNLRPYAEEAKRTGVPLMVRVLPHPDSLAACRAAGIPAAAVIAAQGPFSAEENIATIRKFGVAVLVTKDSSIAGGVPAKIVAAKQEKCRLIVVGRSVSSDGLIFPSIEKLLKYLEINKQMR